MDERDYKALNDSLKDENKHKSAFPSTDGKTFTYDGLTKREYFAGLAMQGMLASISTIEAAQSIKDTGTQHSISYGEVIAKIAVDSADELLKQLSDGK